MSQLIPLEPIPQQSLSIRLEDRRYVISLRFVDDIMAVNITRDDVLLVQGLRVVAGTPVLPYEYLEDNSGNFFFQTENDNLPNYLNFGNTQLLFFFTSTEMEEFRNGT